MKANPLGSLASVATDAFLQRLFNPGVQRALYSRPVIEFVVAYGNVTEGALPIFQAASKQCYDDKINQGATVEEAKHAAFGAYLNELVKIPFPPFPGCVAPPSSISEAPCNPPSQEDFDSALQNAQEQPQ